MEKAMKKGANKQTYISKTTANKLNVNLESNFHTDVNDMTSNKIGNKPKQTIKNKHFNGTFLTYLILSSL